MTLGPLIKAPLLARIKVLPGFDVNDCGTAQFGRGKAGGPGMAAFHWGQVADGDSSVHAVGLAAITHSGGPTRFDRSGNPEGRHGKELAAARGQVELIGPFGCLASARADGGRSTCVWICSPD